jgi:hypothetical protein
MVTTRYRQQMMQQMEDQSLVGKLILARCAAGFCVLVVIAVAGASVPVGPDSGAAMAARVEAQIGQQGNAAAHRREVFEQRRQRYADARAQAGERPPEFKADAPQSP